MIDFEVVDDLGHLDAQALLDSPVVQQSPKVDAILLIDGCVQIAATDIFEFQRSVSFILFEIVDLLEFEQFQGSQLMVDS